MKKANQNRPQREKVNSNGKRRKRHNIVNKKCAWSIYYNALVQVKRTAENKARTRMLMGKVKHHSGVVKTKRKNIFTRIKEFFIKPYSTKVQRQMNVPRRVAK